MPTVLAVIFSKYEAIPEVRRQSLKCFKMTSDIDTLCMFAHTHVFSTLWIFINSYYEHYYIHGSHHNGANF